MSDKNEKNDFFRWASNQSFISEHIDYNDLIKLFVIIEKYALKKGLLYKPFFETVDVVAVRKISERINKDKQFEIRNYFNIKRLKKWLEYYLIYLQEKHEQGSSQTSQRVNNSIRPLKSSEGNTLHDEKEEDESDFFVDEETEAESELDLEDVVEDESDFFVDEEMEVESELDLEDAVEDKSDSVSDEEYVNNECQKTSGDIIVIALDNENIKNLINTFIPGGIEYFGANSNVSSSWKDAYKNVILCLMEDYPELFGKEIYLNIDNEYKYIVAKKKYIDLLKEPIDLNGQLCLETKLEENQMIEVLRELCNRCNLDQNNIVFLCHFKEKKVNNDSLYDDENPDGTNFCDDSQGFVVVDEVTSIDLGQKNAANILAQATPVGVQYFGQTYDGCEDWIQAYKQIVLCLQEDYPSIICNEILVRLENEIKLICTRETKAYLLNRPEKIGEQCCLETDVDVKQIVDILRELANRCKVDFDNIVILSKEHVQIPEEKAQEITPYENKTEVENYNAAFHKIGRQGYQIYLESCIKYEATRDCYLKEMDLCECILKDNMIGTGTLYNVKSLVEGLTNIDLLLNHSVFIERNKLVENPRPASVIRNYRMYLKQLPWNERVLEENGKQNKKEKTGTKKCMLNKLGFSLFLDEQDNLKEFTKKEYKTFITICDSFVWNNKIGSGTLYGNAMKSEVILDNIDKLLKNKEFQEFDRKRSFGLSATLKKYREYIHQIIDGGQLEKSYASLTKELIIEECDEKQVVPTKKTNIGKDDFFKYLSMKEQMLPNNRRLYANKIFACEVFAEVNRIGKGLYEAENLESALKTAELLLKSEDFANYSRNQEDIPKKALENYLEFLETNKNKVEKDDISLICQNKLENSGEKHGKTSSSEYQQKALNKVNLDCESFEYYLKKYVNISDKTRMDYLRKINDCESFVVAHLLGGGLYSAPSVEVALETVDKLLNNEKFDLYSKARLNKPFEALKVYEDFLNMKAFQLNAFDSIENKLVSKDYQRELNEILSRLEKKYKDCPAESFQQVLKENSYAYYVDEMYKNVYGISAKEGLGERGIILSNKEKLDKIVETLKEKYREEKAATFYELRSENPDINFNLLVKLVPQIYNKKIKDYFEEVGILKIPFTQDKVADSTSLNKNKDADSTVSLRNVSQKIETVLTESDSQKDIGMINQDYQDMIIEQEELRESNRLVELTADDENVVVTLERIEKDGGTYRFLRNKNALFTIDKEELRRLQRAINRELMSKNFGKQGFTEEEVLFIESCNTGLYFGLEEMKRAFRRQFPERCDDVFTPSNLIDIGYRYLRNNLVVLEEIRSVEELIERLFFKNRVVDFSENEWILKYNGVYTILSQMKRSYSIVEFEKNKFVNIRELNKLGMNRALLEDYCEQVKKYVKKNAFSVFYLQSSGFKHILDGFGFESYFYESVLKNNNAFKSTRYKGQTLFKQTNEKFSYSDLIVEIIEREGTMDIYDIQQLLVDDYGVKMDLYNIRNFAKEGDLYYSDTMEKIYLDYDDFFEEIE